MKIIPAAKNTLEGLLHTDIPKGNAGDAVIRRIEAEKLLYDKALVISGLHRIKYLDYLHDKEPLTLILDYFPALDAVLGFNFHYLTTNHSVAAIKTLVGMNTIRILGKKGPMVPPALIERMPLNFKPYRLYKIEAIRAMEYIPFDDWVSTVRGEKNKWQGFRNFGNSRLKRKINPNKQPADNKAIRTPNKKPKANKANSATKRR